MTYIMRKGVSQLSDLSDGYQAMGHGAYSNTYPTGKTFYVNYGGNDSASGLDPADPLLTITAANALCTSDKHDTIVVMNYWLNEDGPITLNKRHTTLVGAKSGANWFGGAPAAPAIMLNVAGDTQVLILAERDIAVANFVFDSGASYAAITFTGGAGFVRQGIFNCQFTSGKYGIEGTAGSSYQPSHYLTIKNCIFHPDLTTGGILLGSNGSWPLIENCFFEQVPGPQISITGGSAGGRIINNVFSLDSDTAGEAITLAGSPTRWVIHGNAANDAGTADITACPYVDAGTDNIWIANYTGITLEQPGD
ncbi:MAG: hypothetical protein KAJ19_23640 [Gammaproteobacteria bacterium]|nr:hypothetical protein [Gammaproteobacteria bacterium]